jgi:C1A family cysteine protease
MGLVAGPKSKQLPEVDRANAFKKNFKDALKVMDKLNKDAEAEGNDNVAFGINSHAHLDQADYIALRATGVRSEPLRDTRKARRPRGPRSAPVNHRTTADPTGVSVQATSCTSSTGNVAYSLGQTTAATYVDWVAKNFVTPIRDKGQCGSCVAFGTTVVTEWVLMKRSAASPLTVNGVNVPIGYYSNSVTDLSEDDLMQCERETLWRAFA